MFDIIVSDKLFVVILTMIKPKYSNCVAALFSATVAVVYNGTFCKLKYFEYRYSKRVLLKSEISKFK